MKTGPKPLAPRAFAARHAERLNYKLVEVLADREFKVACLDCGVERILAFNASKASACVCTHKRKFYRTKRTPELHTEEIHEKGYAEYTCLKVGALSKDKNQYRHSCGYEFTMSKDCFVGSSEPCAECRKSPGLEPATYSRRATALGIIPLEEYVHSKARLLHRFVKCGHKQRLIPDAVTRVNSVVRCRKCNPSSSWRSGKVQGKRFKVRSRVEIAFLRLLIDKGYTVDQIEYEPPSGRIPYFNPVKKRTAFYTPDFKVNETYIEVKDMASLGLKAYNWMTAEQALIENRAKCEAARKELGAYRLFVYHKREFHEVHEFWNRSEQQRLTAL